jgi:hypothetical protein
MQCHQARRPPVGTDRGGSPIDQIADGYQHFGPHSGTQGDIVYGETGYEAVATSSKIMAAGEFGSNSAHGQGDACAQCHVYMTDYDPITDFANVGHTFLPRVESCIECHGSVFPDSSYNNLIVSDYDNDGTDEGIQEEVMGLLDILADELVDYDLVNNAGEYLPSEIKTMTNMDDKFARISDSLAATDGDTDAPVVTLRESGFNFVLVLDDGSYGVHNPVYIVQLLQESILYLDNTALPDEVLYDVEASKMAGTASFEKNEVKLY